MSNTRKCVVWRVRTVEVLEAYEVDVHEDDLVATSNEKTLFDLRRDQQVVWTGKSFLSPNPKVLDNIPDDARPVLIEVRDRSRQCDGILIGGIQDVPFQNVLSEKYLHSGLPAARKAIECATETVKIRPRLWGDYFDFE